MTRPVTPARLPEDAGPRPAALTPREAAAYIRMSLSWLEHSDVPRVRLGRAVRYLVTDLDGYLAQRRDRDAA